MRTFLGGKAELHLRHSLVAPFLCTLECRYEVVMKYHVPAKPKVVAHDWLPVLILPSTHLYSSETSPKLHLSPPTAK